MPTSGAAAGGPAARRPVRAAHRRRGAEIHRRRALTATPATRRRRPGQTVLEPDTFPSDVPRPNRDSRRPRTPVGGTDRPGRPSRADRSGQRPRRASPSSARRPRRHQPRRRPIDPHPCGSSRTIRDTRSVWSATSWTARDRPTEGREARDLKKLQVNPSLPLPIQSATSASGCRCC